jgi:hypothetical protein
VTIVANMQARGLHAFHECHLSAQVAGQGYERGVKASGLHVFHKCHLSAQVAGEGYRRGVKLFLEQCRNCALYFQIELVQSAPRPVKPRKACALIESDSSAMRSRHVASSISRRTNQLLRPRWLQHVKNAFKTPKQNVCPMSERHTGEYKMYSPV